MTRLAAPAALLAALLLATFTGTAAGQKPALPAPSSPFGPGVRATPPTGPRYEPGEVIVRYKPDTDSDKRGASRRAGKVKLKRKMRVKRSELVEVTDGQSVRDAVEALRKDPDVEIAEPNYYRYLNSFIPNDGDWARMWGLHNTGQKVDGVGVAKADADIDAPEAWDIQRGSSSIAVAVIDTGIKENHSDLNDNIGSGWDFVHGDSHPEDLEGHGTHVAGTIGAEGNNGFGTTGVAQDVTLYPFKVFGADGYTTDQKIIDAFQLAGNWGAKVANASLGGPGASAMYDAVVRDNPNVLYVVAAGNDTQNNEAIPTYPCNVTRSNLICVAASDQNDDPADFSNWGATSVDIAAPGTEIWSTWPHVVQFYKDTFETSGWSTRWSTGGTNNHWDDNGDLNWTDEGTWSMQDGAGSYAHNTNSWAQHTSVNLGGLSDCGLSMNGTLQAEPNGDYLHVEVSRGGGAWDTLESITPAVGATNFETSLGRDFDISSYASSSEFWLRYRLQTDGDNSAASNYSLDGAYIDDVAVKCANYTSGNHINGIQGTSMATPHVAGAAALLFSQKPSATVAEIRDALLQRGDPLPSTWGARPTTTGRRLNVYKSLLAVSGLKPDTTITSGPPASTRSSTATFSFTSSQPDSTFECSIDNGVNYSACSSGQTFGGYTTHGTKDFWVRAVNPIGGKDPAPAHYSWVVDLQAPDTSIVAKPANVTKETSATFTYSSDESGVSYECSRDQGVTYTACPVAGITYSGLTPNAWQYFNVRAKDAAGNVDPAAASYQWYIDQTPPDTEIFSGPSGDTTETSASFGFSSSTTGDTYECRLTTNGVAGSWESGCVSPKQYSGLAQAAYKLEVRATDTAGNTDATPAERSWRVVGTPPPPPPPARATDQAGWSASTSVRGDFDGDGYDDLAVGVPGEDLSFVADVGAVHVLYGTATGLSGARSWFVNQNVTGIDDSNEAGDRFGASLAVGDFNGDGKSDLAVGVPGEDVGTVTDAGAVEVLLGSATGLSATGQRLWTQSTATTSDPGEAGDAFGATLATGDTTGDGKAELVIGVPGEDVGSAADAGAVQLMAGGATGPVTTGNRFLSQATAYVTEDPEAGDAFGAALALGDYDGDGKADLAVASPGESVGSVAQAGAVHVIAGAAGTLVNASRSKLVHQDTAYVGDSAEADDHFGASLAAGDLGGSASAELAIGVPDEDLETADAGAVEMLMGASGALLTTTGSKFWEQDTAYVPDASEAGDHFGAALAVGNLWGAASGELAIGVPGEDVGTAADAGFVVIVPGGGTSGPPTTPGTKSLSQATAYIGEDAEPGDHFGASLAAADFGDSAEDDLVIGVPDESVGSVKGAGIVQRVPGSSSGPRASDSQILSQSTTDVTDTAETGDAFGTALGR
ncbi:MAG TPA: S8 family serine peptidase [Solirubrobacteraceae bacterium]|jgi:subtilisin family serine protease